MEWGERGVVLDETLRSVSNPDVYAAGDAAATEGPPLTPVAAKEGIVVGLVTAYEHFADRAEEAWG